jgi:hypothetical protein
MSEGTAAEPPNGTPGRRALGAMESAVRRARERTGATTLTSTPPESSPPAAYQPSALPPPPPPPPPRPWAAGPIPPGTEPHRSAQREHWLAVSVAVVAVLVVAAGIALAVSSGGGAPQVASPPSSTSPGLAHGAHPPAAQHATGGSSGHGSRTSRTTTSVAPAATPGGPPVISSITPTSGSAGQGVQVAGSNFLSSDGQIVATFNGQVAPTSCPAQNTCTVTVPPMTGAASAQITITTAGGTSNAVTFTYS